MNRQKIAQELVKLARELTGAKQEVTFLNDDGSVFSIVRDYDSASDLWKRGRWDFVVNGKKYRAEDWRGRVAIEDLFDIISGDEARQISQAISQLRDEAIRMNERAKEIDEAWKEGDKQWLKKSRII